MGAWGYGLFENDNECDIVSELSHEAGLTKLEEDARAAIDGEVTEENDVYYSLLSTTDKEAVRKHMDSGILARMLNEYEDKYLSGEREAFREPGYVLLLLGACAMSLGCTIPPKDKRFMQKVYMCVGFASQGVQQLEKALMGPDGYNDGEPFDLNGPDIIDTVSEHPELRIKMLGTRSLNVWGPGTLFFKPPKGSTAGLMDLKAEYTKKTTGIDVCAGCGAKHGQSGEDLLTCGGCKTKKYCGKECQKKQWKVHKLDCAEIKGQTVDVEMADGGV